MRDGMYRLCKNEFGMIIFSAVSLGGHHHAISYAIVPGETTEAWATTWRGIVQALKYVMKKTKLCDSSECKCCRMISVSLADPEVIKYMASPAFLDAAQLNFPVHVGVSDQVKSWSKFVLEEWDGECKNITCSVHGIGIAHTKKSAMKYFTGRNAIALHEEFYTIWNRAVATP